jgi:hypothetical protein
MGSSTRLREGGAEYSKRIASARICSTRFIGATGARCIGTIGVAYPGTLFHRRHSATPMHSYENRSEIRALRIAPGLRTGALRMSISSRGLNPI